jgi:hypothetical protein
MSITWISTNHLWTLITTKQHTRNYLGVRESAFVMFDGLFFLSSGLLGLWGFVTFSFLINFLQLSESQMHPKEGFKFCLDTKSNGFLPLDPAYLKHISVWSQQVYPRVTNQKIVLRKKNHFLWVNWKNIGQWCSKLDP